MLRVLRPPGVRPRQLRLSLGHAARPSTRTHRARPQTMGAGADGGQRRAGHGERHSGSRGGQGRFHGQRGGQPHRRGDVGGVHGRVQCGHDDRRNAGVRTGESVEVKMFLQLNNSLSSVHFRKSAAPTPTSTPPLPT